MQAIETKYLGPTNARGSRVKASCERGSLTVSYDDGLNSEQAHAAACVALCKQFAAEDEEKVRHPSEGQPLDAAAYARRFAGARLLLRVRYPLFQG